MTKNKSLAARAASRVATEISAGVQNGEYSLPEIRVSRVDAAMDSFGDRITAGFSSMIDRLQTIADSVTFRLPTVATIGAIPYSVTGGSRRFDDTNRLLEAIEKIAGGRQSRNDKGAQYTFIGQIDRRVLFEEMLDEAQLRQSRSGRNPFGLGG